MSDDDDDTSYIACAFAVCASCGKDVLCLWPIDGERILCVECERAEQP